VSTVSVADFGAFVEAVHGHQPFPWQRALVHEITERGEWPGVIDVPTGLGKTSVIDAFVFLRAARPDLARTRLFFVVDRRVVVDEAYDHARRVARALAHPAPGVVTEVAAALRGDGLAAPLQVTRMRGGTTWPWRWLERPDQPAVVVGTVAQVGSRLFFRGYGVGEFRRSIDAALVGADSVVVLDEAHLAAPMIDSFDTAMRLDAPSPVSRPVLVTMSATTNDPRGWAHRWSSADADDPVAGRRLRAAKRLVTTAVNPSKAKADAAVADALAAVAGQLVAQGAQRVGVVANTVARARLAYDRVARLDVDAVLLTGRMREHDRARWRRDWYERIAAGSDVALERPVVQVATQTIEVGVNLDFDGLVTESASLDAVVQRMGRLNRLGRFDNAAAVVVHDGSVTDEDPIYQGARLLTWDWLSGASPPRPLKGLSLDGGLDVGPAALAALVADIAEDDRQAMVRPQVTVPAMTATRLNCLARTSPPPMPDLDVTAFLYGFRDEAPEVTVVWRAGLGGDAERWHEEVELAPPAPEEGLPLPLGAFKRWLRGVPGADQVGDAHMVEAVDEGQAVEDRMALLQAADGSWTAVAPKDVAPGSLVVVPVEHGGVDQFGWAPNSASATDVAPWVAQGGARVVRLGPALLNVLGPEFKPQVDQLAVDLRDDELAPIDVVKAFAESDGLDPALLAGLRQVKIVEGPTTVAVAVCGTQQSTTTSYAEDATAAGSSMIGRRVTLEGHQRQVGDLAEAFARNLGLSPGLVASIRRAAVEHDEGKRDPRFQVMLNQGDRLAAEAGDATLAKSGMDPADRRALRRARQRSGYPEGMRHEALSARIVAARLGAEADVDVDVDLVVHLAASHHGRSRPLLPPVADDSPEVVEVAGVAEPFKTSEVVDWDAPARFERLNRRYGYWGLALCEAIVRLADIAASQDPTDGVLDNE
jgi:CRISPR-associated endonuclease/helicase Cas3